jgi:hypothetical protein
MGEFSAPIVSLLFIAILVMALLQVIVGSTVGFDRESMQAHLKEWRHALYGTDTRNRKKRRWLAAAGAALAVMAGHLYWSQFSLPDVFEDDDVVADAIFIELERGQSRNCRLKVGQKGSSWTWVSLSAVQVICTESLSHHLAAELEGRTLALSNIAVIPNRRWIRADVKLGDVDLGQWLVRNGLALVSPGGSAGLFEIQDEARQTGVGIWAPTVQLALLQQANSISGVPLENELPRIKE